MCIPQTTADREGHIHRLPFIVLESVVMGALPEAVASLSGKSTIIIIARVRHKKGNKTHQLFITTATAHAFGLQLTSPHAA